MTGIEYMNSVCPTTKKGRDPNREDIADAFEDGIAEGFIQCKKQVIDKAAEWLEENLSEYCDGEDIEYTPSSTYNVTILQNERMIEDFKKAMKR